MNLTGLHFGSYWMGKNDVVYLMSQALQSTKSVRLVDTKIYTQGHHAWYREEISPGHTYPIRWMREDKIKKLITSYRPDYIVLNAGGMALTKDLSLWLREHGVVTVGIELSDPDVFPDNGALYSQYFDLFYTNSLFSLRSQYLQEDQYKWLPFAASPRLHRPLPEIEKKHDVVVVGHARPERLKVVANLKRYFSVATYGTGWGDSHEVHGEEHVKVINSGKIYLSFAQTYAGFNNIKVGLFEAAACRTCIVTAHMEEMSSLFTYGIDLVGYDNQEDLIEAVRYYLANPIAREWIATNAYRRILQEHTWERRWKEVLSDVARLQKQRRS
jgi:spore maturation protein CgeB